ncbi:MAG: hypothetical protein QGG01_11435, partial [Roseibacillus sp.]|nr:hypothetical protein [Roseibacillus sp.]
GTLRRNPVRCTTRTPGINRIRGAPASVVAEFNLSTSNLISGQSYPMVVTFRGRGGANRIFTASNQFLMP